MTERKRDDTTRRSGRGQHRRALVRGVGLAGALVVASLAPTHVAMAGTTIRVTTTSSAVADDGACSLPEAVAAANQDQPSGRMAGECPAGAGADTIVIPAGTYAVTPTYPLFLYFDTAVQGGGPDTTVLEGYWIQAANGSSDTVSGLTVDGGGVANNGSQLEVTNTVVMHASRFPALGTVRGTTNAQNVRLLDNAGPGVSVQGASTVTLSGATISGNSGPAGAGIANDGSTVVVIDSTISHNTATSGEGGGIESVGYVSNPASVTLVRTNITDNTAENGSGGGVAIFGTTSLDIRNSSVLRNRAANGGGVFTDAIGESAPLHVSVTTIADNIASGIGSVGGGLALSPGAAASTIDRSSVLRNHAGSVGGGIENFGGPLSITDSTVADNQSESRGGGLWLNDDGHIVLVDRTSVTGNTALSGGGVYNGTGVLQVVNSTVALNTAAANGGGIRNQADMDAIASTIAGNRASFGAGVDGSFASGATTLASVIVAGNTGAANCEGEVSDGGGNLSFPDATCPGVSGDPLLGPLGDNGGPTATMALGNGSAAIDRVPPSACPVPVDQRGLSRPQGPGCDIGAFERASLVSISVTPSNPTMRKQDPPLQFRALGTYADGTVVDLTGDAAWGASDPSIATISSSGLATGLAKGTTTISATVGAVTGTTTLTVSQKKLKV